MMRCDQLLCCHQGLGCIDQRTQEYPLLVSCFWVIHHTVQTSFSGFLRTYSLFQQKTCSFQTQSFAMHRGSAPNFFCTTAMDIAMTQAFFSEKSDRLPCSWHSSSQKTDTSSDDSTIAHLEASKIPFLRFRSRSSFVTADWHFPASANWKMPVHNYI